jgi:RNA polymerase sigma-70 factor (ECF subfamily)
MSIAEAIVEDVRTLVDRALTGDQNAMLQIVDRYKRRVFGLCYRMLGQREDAEDVSQESFIRVLNSLPRWDQTRAFEPWLMTIAANRCRTQLSKRKTHEQSLPFAPLDDRWTDETDAQHLLEEMHLVLKELPENHRRAFELFHQHQLSYAEIATHLSIPAGTVKTWVHRARNELSRRLVGRQVLERRHAM